MMYSKTISISDAEYDPFLMSLNNYRKSMKIFYFKKHQKPFFPLGDAIKLFLILFSSFYFYDRS